MPDSPTESPSEPTKEATQKKPRQKRSQPPAAPPAPPIPGYPPPYMMNPSYPPYQQPYHGSPGPPQPYPYHMPPYPYQYPPAQYQPVVGQHPGVVGQPVVMYSQPPPPQTPSGEASSSKRKRKDSRKDDDTDDDARPSDVKKRTKTARACDSCRSRKIRCDILSDSDPIVCQHCKQYGFECTFFLPITETRFKKKKANEDESHPEKAAQHRPHTEQDVAVFATVPPRTYEAYDVRYHHTFDVFASSPTSTLIQVRKPPRDEQHPAPPLPKDMHIEPELIESLLNAYFAEVAPLLPIVTPKEFLAISPPPPLLLYSMCLVAAARREVPQGVFDNIRYTVNALIRADDVLSTANIVNVQSLLILCMTGDCHSQFVPNALSALWVRLGTAIRMAQDLGLHRTESVPQDIELRRRLWTANTRLPSGGDVNDLYMDELVRLSVLLGRVLKTIYSPSGLNFATDEILQSLFADIEAWRERLPEGLKYKGFGLTIDQWSNLVALTGDAIDWLDANEAVYDVWLVVAYGATSCALVQYHTWARRRDAQARAKLGKLRDCVRRWEAKLSPDHMSARRKTSEIIGLLYEATSTEEPIGVEGPPTLDPTSGVIGKKAPTGIEYKRDPHVPGEVSLSPMSSFVTATPGASGSSNFNNLNPAMNYVSKDPVANVLDLQDVGLSDQLEGIPGGMFDWGQWDTFFARLNGASALPVVEGGPSEEPPK
ncbi:hypothetical protein BDZ89DRAFT_1107500 [Hymenopellis radicata]|nr:hypothetical protein BDZ89DRAFT_1107500 [Hymenopellis radicata]